MGRAAGHGTMRSEKEGFAQTGDGDVSARRQLRKVRQGLPMRWQRVAAWSFC